MKIKAYNSILNFYNNKINFGDKIGDENVKKMTDDGYKFYHEVDLISPKGESIKGDSYVRDYSKDFKRSCCVSCIITDKEGYQLGGISFSDDYEEPSMVRTSLRNYTEKNTPKNFMQTDYKTRSWEDGKVGHVGSSAYKILEQYCKEHFPQIKGIKAYIISSDSWDFHKKMGFDDGGFEYDSYDELNNVMRKKIK